MFFGGAATLISLAFEPLGRVVGWGAYLWLTWTIRVVEWSARLPFGSVSFQLSDLGLITVYAVIGGLTFVLLSSSEQRRALWGSVRARFPLKVTLGAAALMGILAWFAVLQFPDDKLHVTFLDVGQGDAIFVETPDGAQILIDGGPAGSTLLAELGRQMPFWDRTLDLVVLTHPDEDHLTGLIPALERYKVGAVVQWDPSAETDLIDAWGMALDAEGAVLIRGEIGTHMELSDDVTLDILHPGPDTVEAKANNRSVTMRLTYHDVAFLLPGDIEAVVERKLVRSGTYLRSTVLKVPHHGSKTSSCRDFLQAVDPQVAVISVGQDNDFGHPSDDVLERLEGALVYRTDENGTVTITSDGHRLWIETER